MTDTPSDAAKRKAYEGLRGGWNDGRLGQAYDLIWQALHDRDGKPHGTDPILASIEKLDEEFGQ